MSYYTTSRFALEEKSPDIVYLSLFKELLTEQGYDTSKVKFSNRRRHISLLEFGGMLHRSLTDTAGSGLGLKYGAKLNMAAAGTVGQLMMSCETLDQALAKFLTFCQLLSLSLDVNIERQRTDTTVTLERTYCKRLSPEMQQFLTEAVLSCWIHQARWLSGKPLNFRRLQIAYPKPDSWLQYQQLFGCEVEFDCPQHSATLDHDFLDSEVLTACDVIRQLKESDCSMALRRLEKKIPLRERIITMLSKTSPEIPDMDEIAARLNLSRSTLYRKLCSNDTSYQQIVDEFRCKMALEYLRSSSMTLHEISEQLGFSDASNFRRAFKKWTGIAPSSVRSSGNLHASLTACELANTPAMA